jgi:hypothetical protein
VPGRQPSILPIGLLKRLTALTHLLGRQHISNAQHHDPKPSNQNHSIENDSK